MNKQSVCFERFWDSTKGVDDTTYISAKQIFSSGWQQGIQETNEEILELLKALRKHVTFGIIWSNTTKECVDFKVRIDCLISEMEKE